MDDYNTFVQDLKPGDRIIFAGYPLEVESVYSEYTRDDVDIFCIDRENLDEKIKITTQYNRKCIKL